MNRVLDWWHRRRRLRAIRVLLDYGAEVSLNTDGAYLIYRVGDPIDWSSTA